MKKPKIGITSSISPMKYPNAYLLGENYVNSIIDAGGIPIIIPTCDIDYIDEYADSIDGLLLPGGEDINPLLYGDEPVKEVTYMNGSKDSFEIQLVKKMFMESKPIFGICRGAQVINVAFGGTLIQDIPSQSDSKISHRQSSQIFGEPTHTVKIKQNSLMNELLGDTVLVNSVHHQAIDSLADGFSSSAHALDGIVEAIEHKNKLCYAVQWHPEAMYKKYHEFAKLFEHLIELSIFSRKTNISNT